MGKTYRGRKRKIHRDTGRKHKRHVSKWAIRGKEALRTGRNTEARLAGILDVMQFCGEIDSFKQSQPNGELDSQGIDFTIVMGGRKIEFGVTCSQAAWKKTFIKHPGKPLLLIPLDCSEENIKRKVRQLFY